MHAMDDKNDSAGIGHLVLLVRPGRGDAVLALALHALLGGADLAGHAHLVDAAVALRGGLQREQEVVVADAEDVLLLDEADVPIQIGA